MAKHEMEEKGEKHSMPIAMMNIISHQNVFANNDHKLDKKSSKDHLDSKYLQLEAHEKRGNSSSKKDKINNMIRK